MIQSEKERLTKRVKDQQEQMAQERANTRRKTDTAEDRMTQEAETNKNTDFWCSVCEKDFSADGHKTVTVIGTSQISMHRAKCPDCEGEVNRHITHRDQDPYYYKSEKIHRQRNEYLIDTLQAQHYGFKSYYGDPYHKFTEEMKIKDEILWNEHEQMGLKGRSLAQKEQIRRLNRKKVDG